MIEMQISVPHTTERRVARWTDPARLAKAEAQALNRTVNNLQKAAQDALSEEMGIPKSRLRLRGRFVSARTRQQGALPRRHANRHYLEAVLSGYGRPFNLSRWGAKPVYGARRGSGRGSYTSLKTGRVVNPRKSKRGRVLGVQHSAWGRNQFAPRLFMLPLAGRPVVKATGNRTKRGKAQLEGAYGPGVTHVLQYTHVRLELANYTRRRLAHHMASRLQYHFGFRG